MSTARPNPTTARKCLSLPRTAGNAKVCSPSVTNHTDERHFHPMGGLHDGGVLMETRTMGSRGKLRVTPAARAEFLRTLGLCNRYGILNRIYGNPKHPRISRQLSCVLA